MQNKYLPLRIDSATGNFLSGGRYLFDTEHDAKAYKNWVENDFILDGTHFFDSPYSSTLTIMHGESLAHTTSTILTSESSCGQNDGAFLVTMQ